MQKMLNRARLFLVICLLLGWAFLWATSGLITEGIWFHHLGYGDVFVKIMSTRVTVHLIIFVVTFALYFFNLKLALKRTNDSHLEEAFLPPMLQLYREVIINRIPAKGLNILLILIGLGIAAYTTYQLDAGWAIWLQFLYQTPFGIADPVFGLDTGFFVFSLPVLEVLRNIFLSLLLWLLPITATIYVVFNPSQLVGWHSAQLKFSQKHLLVQAGLLLLLIAFDFVLKALRLTLTPNSLFLGAGFTDVYVRLPGYLVSGVLIAILALACFRGFKKWRFKGLVTGVVFTLIVIGLVTVAIPSLVQRLMVEPNQFAKEKIFLEHHITMTQKAYGLTEVEIRQFPAENKISDLTAYQPTIDNIRLWDWRPLQQSYNQLQALSYYYHFNGIDVDRYQIDGQLRQVMLGAREIDFDRFEPHVQTWTNSRLRYTHGYGLVMSPVDEATANGLPHFFIKDIPPAGTHGLTVERPEIYFGELTDSYVITNTKLKEFDYPKGEDNAETVYQGTGGIKLDSYFKKLLFAARFRDYRLLVSGELHNDSEILIHRQIVDRVQRIAPFLRLDDDPYLVLEEGRLYWILDAYTLSGNFPYAGRTPGWGNYIRNSVKVIVDAYNGDVSFYLTDPTDPIALTWQKAFPSLFLDLADMPPGLQAHLRYPVDLFRIQAQIYAKYHMDNPLVFYNDEDAWKIPEERYLAETVSMEPYYTILQLDNVSEPEFVLMLPFIPAKQIANMVGWMAALNDPPNYGKLIVYKFFKDRHVYGPMQIESRIDQDSEISQQLTLWDQRGSSVIRGNLLVIPLDGAILYVEPIFIQSEQSSIPELSRVILVFEDQVVMARTLEEALEQVFGQLPDRTTPAEKAPALSEEIGQNYGQLARQAKSVFEQAVAAQREGDWAAYGDYLKQLENLLNQLSPIASPGEEDTEGSSQSEP
ncbi:MAG: UPF0182 family protein [Clostridia bacterium]|nr:UPF0182 family protein [Clostridia bacterium]